MSVPTTYSPRSTASDAAKGLLALVGVLVLVAGVPAALVAWVGSPLPASMPSPSEVLDALRDTYIPDEFLVNALAVVCWLVWAELVASLLVEAVAYVRGRRAGAVPLAGGLQRGAARLIATVALLGVLVATRGDAGDAATATQRLVPSIPETPSTIVEAEPHAAPEAGPKPAAPAAPAPVYEVQRRDTLWDIAERHLGDPFRWQEIFQINEGCPQADGRCLTDPDLIYAGWQLELPGDAVGLAPAPSTAPAPATPARTDAPAPDTSPVSTAAPDPGAGMVLIDDGAAPVDQGDVLLVSESSPAGAGGASRGMVLLDEDAVDDPGGDAPLTGRPGGEPPPSDDPTRELAGRPDGAGETARPPHD